MDRRTLLRGGLGLLFAPLVAAAQAPSRLFRIGLLASAAPPTPEWEAFFDGLRRLGYVEGRNLIIEGRFYGNDTEQLPILAAELVQSKVDVIVTGNTPAPEAAKRATSTTPIVFTNHPDPVASGLVTSFANPGGNVTGLSLVAWELRGKQFQLLTEVVPGLSHVAVLSNPTLPNHTRALQEVEIAARSLRLQLQQVEAGSPSEFVAAFAAATRERVDALLVLGGNMFYAYRARLAELAAQNRLPALYQFREYVDAGGLISYGANVPDSFRRASVYVDKILRGAKPRDLPVEQPTQFELAINLKTAKALGLTVPQSLLLRADAVIE